MIDLGIIWKLEGGTQPFPASVPLDFVRGPVSKRWNLRGSPSGPCDDDDPVSCSTYLFPVCDLMLLVVAMLACWFTEPR